MALSATLRRAASSAARALAARQGYHSAPLRPFAVGTRGILSASSSCSPSGDAAPGGTSPRPVSARPFSTQPVKVAFPSDPSILQVLDAEIKCAEECDDHERKDEIPDQFPFEIKDVPGSTTVTLSKNYHGEDVKVIVSMPNLVTGDRDDDEVEKDEQKSSQSSLPLVVNVSKGEGTSLEFCCTAYPDEVCIDSMIVREVGLLDEDLAYEGPDFNDLDENLQKAFHKYLEIRGISPSTTNYLHEYMINKDSREYLLWLKNVKQFIQK